MYTDGSDLSKSSSDGCFLDELSKIHNCNSVTDMADYAQVMRDKQGRSDFSSACIFLIRFSTCARTDTSSAETASSQIIALALKPALLQYRYAVSVRRKAHGDNGLNDRCQGLLSEAAPRSLRLHPWSRSYVDRGTFIGLRTVRLIDDDA